MPESFERFKNPEFWRFLVAGGINSLLAYLLYAALVTVVPYQLAYGLSYAAGIGISYLLNARYVFREKYSFKTFFRYPIVYLVQYILGSLLMYVGIDLFSLDKYVAPFLVIVMTIPITFILSRFIIKRTHGSTRCDETEE
jgi:putative flippase GtrA